MFGGGQVEKKFDVIVLGTGIGGLGCAAALARKGKKVLMIEQGDRPGGCLQPFYPAGGDDPCKLWNLGLQWICGYDPKETRTMPNDYDNLMYLSSWDEDAAGDDSKVAKPTLTQFNLDFQFAHFVDEAKDIDFEFTMASNEKEMKRRMIEFFPEEQKALKRYFGYLEKLQKRVMFIATPKLLPRWLGRILYPVIIFCAFPGMSIRLFPFTSRSVQSVVENMFLDARLKMIIYSNWHFLGMAIDKTPFMFFGVAQNLQQRGVAYPNGGADTMIRPLMKTVTDAGGEVRCKHSVTQLEVSKGKLTGVTGTARTEEGGDQKFSLMAPVVISSAGIPETLALIDKDQRPRPTEKAAQKHQDAPSILALRILYKDGLEPFNLGIATYRYVFGETSHEYDDPTLRGWKPRDITINFPSLYDQSGGSCAGARGEVILETRYEYFEQYAEAYSRGDQLQKGTELYDVYQRISDELVNGMAEYFQRRSGLDIRPHIAQTWLTSPLDVESMVMHKRGSIYGLDINKAKDMALQPRSGVKGLYITGEDVFCQGVTFINGLLTASVVLKEWFLALKIPILKPDDRK
jgi:all-trans-retinol 13,14-reductase